MARYIGVDLHRNQFTVCVLAENGREYRSVYRLEQLGRFVAKLRATDEVAVEVTGSTRLFYDAVAPHAAKVVVVKRQRVPGVSRRNPLGPGTAFPMLCQGLSPKRLVRCDCRRAARSGSGSRLGELEAGDVVIRSRRTRRKLKTWNREGSLDKT